MGAVCITGADQVSSLGLGLQELSSALDSARGTAQTLELDLPGPGLIRAPVCRVSAELPGVAPSKVPMDRNTAMALYVAQRAWQSAGWAESELNRDRLGVFWGSGMGGAHTFDQTCHALYAEQRRITDALEGELDVVLVRKLGARRQDVVNAFQNDPNASVFLLSLRAAGTGLNLTAGTQTTSTGTTLSLSRVPTSFAGTNPQIFGSGRFAFEGFYPIGVGDPTTLGTTFIGGLRTNALTGLLSNTAFYYADTTNTAAIIGAAWNVFDRGSATQCLLGTPCLAPGTRPSGSRTRGTRSPGIRGSPCAEL